MKLKRSKGTVALPPILLRLRGVSDALGPDGYLEVCLDRQVIRVRPEWVSADPRTQLEAVAAYVRALTGHRPETPTLATGGDRGTM